ncbi:MAG: tryptophan synthase subunit alpha [Lentisphaerae bacterium GWF2_52_8]|nr:MAG: tryptophan synthase subunit alpha [Lentisphaerae bacterium GWF2_52_8]
MNNVNSDFISKKFDACRKAGRAAFVAYVAAGDPDYKASLGVIDSLVAGGIDILELGVPFSDPLADGEANQLAANRAIESGMNARKTLDLARDVRERYPDLPIVLFTYLNPVAYAGDFEEYCRQAVTSGVNAMLPLDMPPEESAAHRMALDKAGLPLVSLVAPTSSPERIKLLAGYASAFVYYVCREGVTGERTDFAEGVAEQVALIRKSSPLPIVVGFGISTPEQVRAAVKSGPDGVVVGSAIVRKVEALSKGQGTLDGIRSFVAGLAAAMKA